MRNLVFRVKEDPVTEFGGLLFGTDKNAGRWTRVCGVIYIPSH